MSINLKDQFISGLDATRFELREKEQLWRMYKEDVLPNNSSRQALLAAIDKLNQAYPMAYISGIQYFYRHKFHVGPGVLIPRPETEELVQLMQAHESQDFLRLMDIGTGTACIPISLKMQRPQWEVWAMEYAEAALAFAGRNISELAPDILLKQDDVLNPIEAYPKFDVLVSNPPYILPSEQNVVQASVDAYEPHLALYTTNDDPLQFYKAIYAFAEKYLHADGRLYFECSEFYARELQAWFESKGANAKLFEDMQGKARMLMVDQLKFEQPL